MLEFNEDTLIGESQNYWGDSHNNLYVFNEHGKGLFIPSNNEIEGSKEYNLAWKINKNGILIVKTDFDNETYFLKITAQDNEYFKCTKHIRKDKETEFIETVEFVFIDIEKDLLPDEYNSISIIKSDFNTYENKSKILIISVYLLFSILVYLLLSFVPFLNSTAFWLKSIFVLSIVIFTYRQTYYLITKIVKNRNKNDSKHDR
jgi:hypothetical protein